MSFLNAVINNVEDADLRERLQDRVDLVQHKIKFMDKVPVVCLDTLNKPVMHLEGLLSDAGGVLEVSPSLARVLIYCESGTSLLQMMGSVPVLLDAEWPAVQYSRVYLWEDDAAGLHNASLAVGAFEDLAELLYPGYFVFGNEGKSWISFKTQ